MGLFLAFCLVGVLIVLFIYGFKPSGVKRSLTELRDEPGLVWGVTALIMLVSILLSLFVSFCYQSYLSTDHERFEIAWDRPLARLGSVNDTDTYLLGRAESPSQIAWIKYKYYDDKGGLHGESPGLSQVSIIVTPGKAHVVKTVRWVTDQPNFWIWDYRWGIDYTLYVPNGSGVESELLRELMVKQ